MPHKYSQLSRASNPSVYCYDGWIFATAQLAEVDDSEFVPSEPCWTPAEKRSREATGQHIPPPAKIPLSDVVVLIEVVDPGLDLVADFCETRHRLCCRDLNEFLRLGGRESFKNEVALQDLFPALATTGPLRCNGPADRLTPVRAVRRCGFASHGAVSWLLLCHNGGHLAKGIEYRKVCNTFAGRAQYGCGAPRRLLRAPAR